jgi:hypothetical protein
MSLYRLFIERKQKDRPIEILILCMIKWRGYHNGQMQVKNAKEKRKEEKKKENY